MLGTVYVISTVGPCSVSLGQTLPWCETQTVHFSAVSLERSASVVCPKNLHGILNKKKSILGGMTATANKANVAGSSSSSLLLITMVTTARVNITPSCSEKALLQIAISDPLSHSHNSRSCDLKTPVQACKIILLK